MGSDQIKVRYLFFKDGAWRWRPTKTMRAAGFRTVKLSAGRMIDGRPAPSAPDIARAWRSIPSGTGIAARPGPARPPAAGGGQGLRE
jgi:hypothetical protein